MPKGDKIDLTNKLCLKYSGLERYKLDKGRFDTRKKSKIFSIITSEEKDEFMNVFDNKFKDSRTEVNMEDTSIVPVVSDRSSSESPQEVIDDLLDGESPNSEESSIDSIPNDEISIINHYNNDGCEYEIIDYYSELKNIKVYLEFSYEKKVELISKINSITNYVSKMDGNGLLGSSLKDLLITEFLANNIKTFYSTHTGESDFSILNILFSLKNINGASACALNWSKGNKIKIHNPFTCHIIVFQEKTLQWWKQGPKNPQENINYTRKIKKGIYICSMNYCRKNITKLGSNNKTDTLISKENMYRMLTYSEDNDLFINFENIDVKNYDFSILNSFKNTLFHNDQMSP